MKLCARLAVLLAGLLSACSLGAQQIAITFDDLPMHGEKPADQSRLAIAQSILTTLKAQKMPPVYGFVNGLLLAAEPSSLEVLKTWRSMGEPLGNHTYAHSNLDTETAKDFEADVEKNEALLQGLMGADDWHFLRYPYLDEGDTLEKRNEVRAFLGQHGYRVAEVSMDFEDYLWNSPYSRCVATRDEQGLAYLRSSYLEAADQSLTVFRGMSKKLYGREIPYVLLLHIGAFDARMLPELIDLYRRRGFTFVSLPDAENDPAYELDPGVAAKASGTMQQQMALAKGIPFPPNGEPEKKLDSLCRVPGQAPSH